MSETIKILDEHTEKEINDGFYKLRQKQRESEDKILELETKLSSSDETNINRKVVLDIVGIMYCKKCGTVFPEEDFIPHTSIQPGFLRVEMERNSPHSKQCGSCGYSHESLQYLEIDFRIEKKFLNPTIF